MAQILAPTIDHIALAADILHEGGVIGLPTETVYGLAGRAFDQRGVTKIFETKERPKFDPLIVHVGREVQENAAQLGTWIDALTEAAVIDPASLSPRACERVELLLNAFWPGPLTLVLPKHENIPLLVTSGLNTVAVRMPRHEIALDLISHTGPLAAPSANRFGRISPTSAADVERELGDRIPVILDGGNCQCGLESTVLLVEPKGDLVLLRSGSLTAEVIAEVVGEVPAAPSHSYLPEAAAASPGQLKNHYAPRKPLYLLPSAAAELSPQQLTGLDSQQHYGLLTLKAANDEQLAPLSQACASLHTRCLSETGDVAEMARNFFTTLRELDGLEEVDVILAEPVTNPQGLLHAIQDRLQRASAGSI